MTKANITQYSSTPSSNSDINDINIAENCPASNINNAIRELMAHLKNVDTGSQALTALSVTGDLTVTGDIVSNTAGTSNFRAGVNAGDAIASGGNYNTVVGDEAGTAITTGDSNVAVGFEALKTNTTASGNNAIGSQSLKANTDGASNIAIGQQSMFANTTGSNNTVVGHVALGTNTSGSNNVAVGDLALNANTTASNNTAVGSLSLDANTEGTSNTALGRASLTTNTTGSNNVGIGVSALEAVSTGGSNVAVGNNSLVSATGSNNTVIGHGAGSSITSGTKNTIVGSYNGNQDGYDLRTADNYIVLSDGDGNVRFLVDNNGRSRIQGTGSYNLGVFKTFASSDEDMIKFFRQAGGNDTSGTTCGQIITTASNTTAYQTSSDYRLKENVNYDFNATSRLKQLKPARFNFKVTPDKTVDGFLAHEVESVVPNAVSGVKDAVDEEGAIIAQGIDHGFLVPLLTKTLQETITKIESLETENKTQATQIADLISRVTALENA